MIAWMLTPLSWIFWGCISFRHFLYDKKILAKKYLDLPVVSIGNVVVGGAGKTQVALLLAQQLSETLPLAILSRGFRGKAEKTSQPLVIDVKKNSPLEAGDEPWLLANRLQAVSVIANKNRFKSALIAKQRGARLILLDDGMQHRKLHRDFEIVVIDGNSPFDSFLPKGRLREDTRRLKFADLIIFIDHPEPLLKNQVEQVSQAAQVTAVIRSKGFYDLNDQPVEFLAGQKVGLFCGIGNPRRFVKTVESLNLHVVTTLFAADHLSIKKKALASFAKISQQKGATHLVCTEKDKIKFLGTETFCLPIVWLKVNLEIVDNQKKWISMLDAIKQRSLM